MSRYFNVFFILTLSMSVMLILWIVLPPEQISSYTVKKGDNMKRKQHKTFQSKTNLPAVEIAENDKSKRQHRILPTEMDLHTNKLVENVKGKHHNISHNTMDLHTPTIEQNMERMFNGNETMEFKQHQTFQSEKNLQAVEIVENGKTNLQHKTLPTEMDFHTAKLVENFKSKQHEINHITMDIHAPKIEQNTERMFNGKQQNKITYHLEQQTTDPLDLLATTPITFLPNFKNPCWYGSKHNGPLRDRRLHCLPHFYIIGFMKTGTTEMFKRIHMHPEYERTAGFKEAQWFNSKRFYKTNSGHLKLCQSTKSSNYKNSDDCLLEKILKDKDIHSLEYYASMFDIAAKGIYENPTRMENGSVYYNYITGEKSPSIIGETGSWRKLKENKGLDEPKYTALHYIKHINPKAKIIIQMRDPVTRLLSNYLHSMKHSKVKATPNMFHDRVMYEMNKYKSCLEQASIRKCIYSLSDYVEESESVETIGRTNFKLSFYAFYIKEILSVFPKEQVLPVLTMDMDKDMPGTLQNLFNFIGIRNVTSFEMKNILEGDRVEAKPEHRTITKMNALTEKVLYDFFEPFNKEMADFMDNSKYLFPNPN